MLRLWVESYRTTQRGSASALLSVATHALLIAAAVQATRPEAGVVPQHALANRIFYLPPPDRHPAQQAQGERIQFLQLGVAAGAGVRFIDAPTGQDLVGTRSTTPGWLTGLDSLSTPELPRLSGVDSVYSVLEVDSTVARDPLSAAPVYPPDLLSQGVQGYAMVRYVVDTTGRALLASFAVVDASHDGFSQAVREALPLMRFSPARIQGHAVRQMVEQEFSFRIDSLLKRTSQAGRPRADSLAH